MRFNILCLLGCVLGFGAGSAGGQSPTGDTRQRAPDEPVHKVGLVLSGGAAKGLAHVGVLQVLEEVGVPIDVVTGTSMGAVIGGTYAVGYTPAAIAEVVTRLPWSSYFQDTREARLAGAVERIVGTRTQLSVPLSRGRPQLPGGVIAGQRIGQLLARLTWPAQTVRDFRRLPTPFTAVGTDLESGQAVTLDSGSLATALRASMALPALFEPEAIGGRTFADGGLARNLPAQEARALGADFIICSDVSDSLLRASDLRTLADVMTQAMAYRMVSSTNEQRRLCDVYIRPELGGLTLMQFERAPEWIARGAAATRAQLARLRPAVDTARAAALIAARPSYPSLRAAPVRVRGIVVRDADDGTRALVRRLIRVHDGAVVTPDDLDAGVERAFATGLFRRVGYALEATDTGSVVVVSASPATEDRLGFGFRYDDQYRAALLLTATLRSQQRPGRELRLDARLGEQYQLAARVSRAAPARARLLLSAAGEYLRSPIDLYTDGLRASRLQVSVARLTTAAGLTLGHGGALSVQLKGEHTRAATLISPLDTSRAFVVASAAGLVYRNTTDREAFPTRGQLLRAKSEWAVGSSRFSHHRADAVQALPIGSRLVVIGRATAGLLQTRGDDLPPQYWFFLGGPYVSPVLGEAQVPFLGLEPQERFGRAVQRIRASVQWEVSPRLFATLHADAGRVSDRLRIDLSEYDAGFGASVGALTIVGPIELWVSGRSFDRTPRLALTLGPAF